MAGQEAVVISVFMETGQQEGTRVWNELRTEDDAEMVDLDSTPFRKQTGKNEEFVQAYGKAIMAQARQPCIV